MENVADQFDTERYVFVGDGPDDEAIAEEAGWEYLQVEQAAEAAEWTLGEPQSPDESDGESRDDWP